MPDILNALHAHALGNIGIHKINIQIYMDNPVGVGEHSDVLEAIQTELDRMAVHQDRLELIERMQHDEC